MLSGFLKRIVTRNNLRRFFINLLFDVAGSFFFAIGIYNFAANASFAPGGVTGIAFIVRHYTHLPIGTLTLMLNIPIILIALKILGKKYLLRTFQTILINTLFLDVISPHFPVYQGEPLLAALFAGALVGLGLAIIYSNKSSTGGSDLIIMSLRKLRPHMSVGQITMFVDGVIVLCGGLVFRQVDAVLYGFIYSAAMILVVDKIMFGFVSGKMAVIVSVKGDEIAEQIGKDLDRGSTILHGTGAYSRDQLPVILCACSRSQVPEVRRIVKRLDPDALMIVTSYDEVYGEGFMPIDES